MRLSNTRVVILAGFITVVTQMCLLVGVIITVFKSAEQRLDSRRTRRYYQNQTNEYILGCNSETAIGKPIK
jgi:hypothetical protein